MKKKILLFIISISLIINMTNSMALPTMQSMRKQIVHMVQSNKARCFVGFFARHKYPVAAAVAASVLLAIPKTRHLFTLTGPVRFLIHGMRKIKFKLGLYPSNALHRAIERNDIEEVQLLATDVRQRDGFNAQHNTPLSEAALNGNREIVQILLRAGSILDNPNVYLPTAIHAAARNGNRGVMHDLIEAFHGDLGIQDGNGYTPLHIAAENGHLGAVEELIAARAPVNVMTNFLVWSPLHRAANLGHTDVAQALINSGADIDALGRGFEGETPLHLAALRGHHDTARMLIRSGANINILDGRGRTFDQVTYHPGFRDYRGLTDDLITTVQQANREAARALINLGASAVSTDLQGNTAIHSAIRQTNPDEPTVLDEIAKDILRTLGYRAVRTRNSAGQTPLHVAAQQGNTRIARLLLRKYGADVNAQDSLGNTALHLIHDNKIMRDLLVSYHADATIKNHAGDTPISCNVNLWQHGFGIQDQK